MGKASGHKKPRKCFVFQGFYNLSAFAEMLCGSPARIRTTDAVVNSHLLCLLSYWGICGKLKMSFKGFGSSLSRKNYPQSRLILRPSSSSWALPAAAGALVIRQEPFWVLGK